ncbi:MAG: PucR family transcriptional regulator ligand-binding domain-containing protein, partial [Firmicutes bacterium]|nr:PucR family transcriptional regulator ligand-binding domain-containing protein [Bacillota bacterium]
MSVTVNDVMKLPCMSGAKVVAGEDGLTRALSAVTVLEFAEPNDVQQEILENIDFYGSELVITAFAHIPDNVQQQCDNIRRLASVGEAGMILYYVGIFMPQVDPALIKLADELDFVLIVMPENRLDLRYSEVITEVMEAIIKDQTEGISLLTDVLDQMCRLPEHHRTVDAVLRMARDRIRTSIILADRFGHILGQSNWPMSLEVSINEFTGFDIMTPVSVSSSRTVWRCPLNQGNPDSMELYLVKDGSAFSKEVVFQAVELVRLASSLWSNKHDDVEISELIRAIFRDEPLKMRRLAELFNIDIASIHSMWVLKLENVEESQRQKQAMETLSQLRNLLEYRCDTSIADMYEGYIVGFMAWRDKNEDVTELGNALVESLAEEGISVTLVRCQGLVDTNDVRRAFLLIKEHTNSAKSIWPTRQGYSLAELEYVAMCHSIVDRGEESIDFMLKPLKQLEDFSENTELSDTLSSYLLDANNSVSRCAELLFVHKNTIKYRLGRIAVCFGHHVDKEPEKS